MSCDKEILVLISAYADGEATPDESVRAAEHLAGCASCRQMVEQWQGQRQVLEWAYTLEIPPVIDVQQVAARAKEGVRVSINTRVSGSPVFASIGRNWVRAAGLAAVLLVAFLIYRFAILPQDLPVGKEVISQGHTQKVRMKDGVSLRIGPDAVLRRIDANSIRLEKGWVTASVTHGTGFRVLTPRMEVLDRGTVFRVGAGESMDYVAVTEGNVSVSTSDGQYDVRRDQVLVADDKGEPRIVALPVIDPMDNNPGVPLSEGAAHWGTLPGTAVGLDWADGLGTFASRFPSVRLEFVNARDGSGGRIVSEIVRSDGTKGYTEPLEMRHNYARLLSFRQGIRAHFVEILQASAGIRVDAGEWEIPVCVLQAGGIISPKALPDDMYFVQLVGKNGTVVWRLTGSNGSQAEFPLEAGVVPDHRSVNRGLGKHSSSTTTAHADGSRTTSTTSMLFLTDFPGQAKPMLTLTLRAIPISEIAGGEQEMLAEVDRLLAGRKDFSRNPSGGTLLFLDRARKNRCLISWNQEAGKQLCRLSDSAKQGRGGSVILGTLVTDVSLKQPKTGAGVYLIRLVLPSSSESPHLEITSPGAQNDVSHVLSATKAGIEYGGFGFTPESLPGYGTVNVVCGTRIPEEQMSADPSAFPLCFQVIGRPDDRSTRVITRKTPQGTSTSHPNPKGVWAEGWVWISKP